MTNKFFPIYNNLLTNKIIKDSFLSFWFETSRKFKSDNFMQLILKIQFENENIVSLTNLVKVNKESKEGLLEYLIERFSLADESYKSLPITGIIFTYSFKKGKIKGTFSKIDSKISTHVIDTKNRTRLPIAYKIEDYGKIITELNLVDNKKFYYIALGKDKYLKIIQDNNINKISYLKKDIEIYNWIDKITSTNELTRTINNRTFIFKNGEVVL